MIAFLKQRHTDILHIRVSEPGEAERKIKLGWDGKMRNRAQKKISLQFVGQKQGTQNLNPDICVHRFY